MDTTERAPLMRYLILGCIALIMLYPLIWLVGASFKSNTEIFSSAGFLPNRLDFSAYAAGWKTSTEYTFATYFFNSFVITVPQIIHINEYNIGIFSIFYRKKRDIIRQGNR